MSDEKTTQSDPQIEELPVEAVSGEEAENVTGGLLPAVKNVNALPMESLNPNINPNLNPSLNPSLNR